MLRQRVGFDWDSFVTDRWVQELCGLKCQAGDLIWVSRSGVCFLFILFFLFLGAYIKGFVRSEAWDNAVVVTCRRVLFLYHACEHVPMSWSGLCLRLGPALAMTSFIIINHFSQFLIFFKLLNLLCYIMDFH